MLVVALQVGGSGTEELRGEKALRQVLPLGGSTATVFVLSLGIIGMAGEYRHGTIAYTMLAAPPRWQIVAAKLLAYALAGLAVGILAVVVTYAIAAPWMASKEAGFSLGGALPREVALGSLLTCALLAAIGVGLVVLVKDQVVALLIGVGWTLVIDTAATSAAPAVGKFFPGGAAASLMRQPEEGLLPMGLGGLVLLAYVAVFAILGIHVAQRRDLT